VSLGSAITDVLGSELPVRIRAYDGTDLGPKDAATTLTIRSPDAVIRMVMSPGEVGIARAYVAGDLCIDGDIYDALDLRHVLPGGTLRASELRSLLQQVELRNLRWLPPPPEEHRGWIRSHTRSSDASAISHHYDISNDFYRLVLGSSLTYSCAVFDSPADSLEQAQENKHELICTKLDLVPGMRLLDVGCGWGSMVLHAVKHHDVTAVGVTISQNQAGLAAERVAEDGLSGKIEIRLQDYRDITDGPFDAISSIGMFEHVGLARLEQYFATMTNLLAPGGRIVNHAISKAETGRRKIIRRRGFIERYVFPDGELHEVGRIVTALQDAGLEVRHVENLREHYALTLRRWVANLEENWEAVVREAGEARARIWRLYMAASAVNFEDNHLHIDQIVAVRTPPSGRASVPLRPQWR
jgi:cyclopropane-fatty-acyl-phospholipid synthase